jgi:hypothetical protein
MKSKVSNTQVSSARLLHTTCIYLNWEMKNRTLKSFNTWEEAAQDDLNQSRRSTPQERMQVLYDLIELYDQLPSGMKKGKEDPYLIRRKSS